MRKNTGWATKRGLWRDAYREMLRPRTIVAALASVVLFTVAMTIFGPLGTLEAFRPLPRFAYWALCGAITFPLCYATAAVALYLTRSGSLIEIMPVVLVAVLLEGSICTAVVIAADLLFIPHAPTPDPGTTYLTVTAVVAVTTFFTHYVVFLRIGHNRAAADDRSASGAVSPTGRHAAAPAAPRASGTVPSGSSGEVGTSAPDDSALARGESTLGAVPPLRTPRDPSPDPAPRTSEPRARIRAPASERSAGREKRARFYHRLSRTVSRDIVYLKMDDHYVNVYTSAGSCLVLMRLADAIAELDDLGMQVHRSYWVAHRHMLAEIRRDGRPMVRVTGGHLVPISRLYLPAVRDALLAKPSESHATDELHDS